MTARRVLLVTKPWNNSELKATLAQGFQHLDRQREGQRVGALVERRTASF